MKLGSVDIVSLDGGAEISPIIGFKPNIVGIFGHGIEAMHEIEMGRSGEIVEKLRGLFFFYDSVPSHVRDFEGGRQVKTHDLARNNSKPFKLAPFESRIEEELQAKADSKKGSLGFDELMDGCDEPSVSQFRYGVSESTHPWQNELFSGCNRLWVRRDDGSPANVLRRVEGRSGSSSTITRCISP